MKTSFYFFLFLIWLPIEKAEAQIGTKYSNSWIDQERQYFKIEVRKEGLYQVPFANLPKELQGADLSKLQLFRNGKEISVLASNTTNGLVFYGVPNTGTTDSLLYRPMSSRVNKYSSLFSNTSGYFVAIGKEPGKRAKTVEANTGSENATQSHRERLLVLQEAEYSLSTASAIHPKFMNSFYERGASKSGVKQLGDTLIVTSIQSNNMLRSSSAKPNLEILFHGRSYYTRVIEISVGKDAKSLRRIGEITVVDFDPKFFNTQLEYSDFSDDGRLFIGYKSRLTERLERISLTYSKLEYDQPIKMNGQGSKYFNFSINGEKFIRLKPDDAPSDMVAYDVTDEDNPVILAGNIKDFTIPVANSDRYKIFLSKEKTVLQGTQLTKMDFPVWTPSSHNYIVITNETLMDAAKSYAEYRASKAGGGYNTLVVNIKDIYNQFNYGEASPIGVRRFMDFMLSDGKKDKYLFLIGNSTTYMERMKPDLSGDVPTIGYPGSDVLLVTGLQGANEDYPAIPVGRLGASTPDQVFTYLNKVKQYESSQNFDVGWRKNALHINGGKTIEEINSFSRALENLSPAIKNSSFGGQIKKYVKQSLVEVEEVDISKDVNQGVGLITYVGHGAQTVTDLDFGYVSPQNKNFSNAGKYPMMYFNGCGVGNIFNNRLNPDLTANDKMPLALDWMLAKDKGAIVIIANSFESYVSPSLKYLGKLYESLFNDSDSDKLSIGRVQQNAIGKVLRDPGLNDYDIANIHQSLLNGDPAIHLLHVAKPDYSIDEISGITISSTNAKNNIKNSDSLRIKLAVANLGKYIKTENVTLRLKFLFNGGAVQSLDKSFPSWSYSDTLGVTIPNHGRSLREIVASIDPDNILNELSKENNTSSLSIDWEVAEIRSSYWLSNTLDEVPPQLEVTLNDKFITNGKEYSPAPEISITVMDDRTIEFSGTAIEFYYKNCIDDQCVFKQLTLDASAPNKFEQLSSRSYKLTFPGSFLSTVGEYQLLARVKDAVGNISKPYIINFKIQEPLQNVEMVVSPNPASEYVRFYADLNGTSMLDKVNIDIYNLLGVKIFSQLVESKSKDAFEMYWRPNVPSGLYIYRVKLISQESALNEMKGKIVIVK
jgi:hypothetical protein